MCSADRLSSEELGIFSVLACCSIVEAALELPSIVAAIDLTSCVEVADARSAATHIVLDSVLVLVAGRFGAPAAANHAQDIQLK